MKVVSLWSGGKDSCFACYKAVKIGHNVISLFNFTEPQGINSLSHNLSARLIQKQAEATGIHLLQKAMPKEHYSRDFKLLINEWKKEKGIEGVVFGDIYLQEHKDWVDRVCQETGVKPVMPVWGVDTKELIEEFIRAGFKAIVVATRVDLLGQEWLGRQIDKGFVEDLTALGTVDFCGEKGEFHTFVYDGPIFKTPVPFTNGKQAKTRTHSFLEIIPEERRL